MIKFEIIMDEKCKPTSIVFGDKRLYAGQEDCFDERSLGWMMAEVARRPDTILNDKLIAKDIEK